MRVLGIMGSPRIGGNTDILLDAALKGAAADGAEIEKLSVTRLKIGHCRECYTCRDEGVCVQRDDMDEVGEKLLAADRVIIASPIFFYGLSSQLKTLIDRGQAYWMRKYELGQQMGAAGRKGAFIGVGATSGEKLFNGVVLTVRYFFKAFDIAYSDELLVRGVDAKAEILEHPDVIAGAEALGKKLAGGD